MTEPYNPLAKRTLARTIKAEILSRDLVSLDALKRFEGAGAYAIYYCGALEFYEPLANSLATATPKPIYVGKAIRAGGRIGGLGPEVTEKKTHALFNRLRRHAQSVTSAQDLSPSDFKVRYLPIDDVWIPLGENMLIDTFQPVWNKIISGFGNNPLGSGRDGQKIALWDLLHPGRVSLDHPGMRVATRDELKERVRLYLAGQAVPEGEPEELAHDDDDA